MNASLFQAVLAPTDGDDEAAGNIGMQGGRAHGRAGLSEIAVTGLTRQAGHVQQLTRRAFGAGVVKEGRCPRTVPVLPRDIFEQMKGAARFGRGQGLAVVLVNSASRNTSISSNTPMVLPGAGRP